MIFSDGGWLRRAATLIPRNACAGTRDCQGIDWPIKAELRASRAHMAERKEKAAETVGGDESAAGAAAIETRGVKLQR